MENTWPTVEQLNNWSISVEQAEDRALAYLREKGREGIRYATGDQLFRGFLGSALASVRAKVEVRRDLEEKAIEASRQAGGRYNQKLPPGYILAELRFTAYLDQLRQAFNRALGTVWKELGTEDEPPQKRRRPDWGGRVIG